MRLMRRISVQSSAVCWEIEASPPEIPALAKKTSSLPCALTASFDQALHVSLAAGIGPNVGSVGDIGADDGRAFAAEQLDRRFADARRRAGDDRYLACQTSVHGAAHSRGL